MFKYGGILFVTFVALAVLAPVFANQFECYKGFCTSWCNDENSGDWCYTTKGRKNDEGWVGCTSLADCDRNWECGGMCHSAK